MKFVTFIFTLLFFFSACDGNIVRPKGSDREWQQRQEQLEREKFQDIEDSDKQMEREQDMREVNLQKSRDQNVTE